MSVRGLRSLRRNDEGSGLIEGAIIVPFLLVLVLGVFEFSWLIYQQHLISTGIHDGARYIAPIGKPQRPNDPKEREEASDHGRHRRRHSPGQGLDDARCQHYLRLR